MRGKAVNQSHAAWARGLGVGTCGGQRGAAWPGRESGPRGPGPREQGGGQELSARTEPGERCQAVSGLGQRAGRDSAWQMAGPRVPGEPLSCPSHLAAAFPTLPALPHPVSCSSKPPGERLLPIGRRRLLRPELSASNRPQLVASPWTGGRRVLAKALGTRFLSSPSPSWTLPGRVIPEAPVTVGLAPGRGWLPICPFSARMHLSPQCSMGAAAAGLPPPGSPPHMPPSCADPPHGPPAGCRVLYEPLLQSREEGALHGLRQPPSLVAGACCTARPEQWGARAGLLSRGLAGFAP